MPHFFQRNELTDEQKARWDHALVTYDQVLRENVFLDAGETPTDAEWAAIKKDLISSYQPGHEKSSLFARLLQGKAPLRLPPPTAYSYPWYEVIESDKPLLGIDVSPLSANRVASVRKHWQGPLAGPPWIDAISIHQSTWVVLREDADGSREISCRYWIGAGYRWKLQAVKVLAAEAPGHICCWHDPSKKCIETRDELMKESAWQVDRLYANMRRVACGYDPEPDFQPSGGVTPNLIAALRAEAESSMQERMDAGLPALPTNEEISAQVLATFNGYIAPAHGFLGYDFDAQDRLLSNLWRLERVAGDMR